jgi:hypothetical protein
MKQGIIGGLALALILSGGCNKAKKRTIENEQPEPAESGIPGVTSEEPGDEDLSALPIDSAPTGLGEEIDGSASTTDAPAVDTSATASDSSQKINGGGDGGDPEDAPEPDTSPDFATPDGATTTPDGDATTPNTSTGVSGAGCKGDWTSAQINEWITKAGAGSASTIYVYIPPGLSGEAKRGEANIARVGFLKALFHTSFLPEIGGFSDVSAGTCAVYSVDLQAVWGAEWQTKWDVVKKQGGMQDTSFDPARQRFVDMSGTETSDLGRKVISAQRLAYNLTFPTNYVHTANIPNSNRDLELGQTYAIGGLLNGIPCGPRYLQLRALKMNGKDYHYFLSSDPGSPGDPNGQIASSPPGSISPNGGDIPRTPGRNIGASEAYHMLPNGFIRYFIWRNPGDRGTKALQSGAIDPANPHNNFTLVTGRSCISCHNNGVRGGALDTHTMGNGYSDKATWEKHFTDARNQFFGAMEKIVKAVSSGSPDFNERLVQGRTREPVAYLIAMIEGPSNARGPYGQCNQGGEDKYGKQVRSQTAQITAELQAMTDTGTAGTGPTTTNTTLVGAAEFNQSCARSGCHTSPKTDSRLASKVASQKMLGPNYGNVTDPEKVKLINQYLQGL